jgi:acyl-[acyl-carrier-protein] desaturase
MHGADVFAMLGLCVPQVLPILKPVEKCWQPADFLPPSEDPDFLDKVRSQHSSS